MRKNTKTKLKSFLISLIPLLAFLFSIWLVVLGVQSFLNNSSYFRIKKVVLNGLDDKKVAQHISQRFLFDNIFTLDINRAEEELKIENPQYYDVEILRNSPDQITVNVIIRRPFAQIEQKGFFLIDSEGVIISRMSNQQFNNFIVITGLKNISTLSFGKKINKEDFRTSLGLIFLLQDTKKILIPFFPALADNKIKIDLSKYPSVYVYFDKLELRLRENNLEKELELFKKILPSIENRINEVKYIDLRFTEPAVSFRK